MAIGYPIVSKICLGGHICRVSGAPYIGGQESEVPAKGLEPVRWRTLVSRESDTAEGLYMDASQITDYGIELSKLALAFSEPLFVSFVRVGEGLFFFPSPFVFFFFFPCVPSVWSCIHPVLSWFASLFLWGTLRSFPLSLFPSLLWRVPGRWILVYA